MIIAVICPARRIQAARHPSCKASGLRRIRAARIRAARHPGCDASELRASELRRSGCQRSRYTAAATLPDRTSFFPRQGQVLGRALVASTLVVYDGRVADSGVTG